MADEQTAPSPAKRASKMTGAERRVAVRHSCTMTSLCQTDAAGLEDFWWRGEIRDFSTGGIGLLIQRRFEPGTQLVIEPLERQETAEPLVVSVIRATRQTSGAWLLGCEFVCPSDGRARELAQWLPALQSASNPDSIQAP